MKKPVVKVMSLTVCAVLTLGSLGGTVYAMNTAGNPAPVESAPTTTAAKAAPAGEKNIKDETVYVLARADGSVEKIIVSDWVQNTRGGDTIHDVTQLTDIENVKGNETYTLDGDNTCVWDARGNDIYYQGSIDRELPVSVTVSYALDGAPITPEELAGKSGKVAIRFDYANHQYEMVGIGGKQEKIYVPFAILTGVVLDNDVFANVSVSNGKIVNDGDRTIVAGLALPGLQDSLGLGRDALAGEHVADHGGVILGVAEHQHPVQVLFFQDGHQVLEPLAAGGAAAILGDPGAALLHRADGDLLGVPLVEPADVHHLPADGGGEHHHLLLFGQAVQDTADVLEEAHVQHLVRLVQHHGGDLVHPDGAVLHVVHQPPGGGHHDLRVPFQRLDLGPHGLPAVDGGHPHPLPVLG